MSKHTDNNRRVVITGLGVVSSLGIGWQPFWKNLLAGQSGISRVTAFDTIQYDRHNAGEVKNFDPVQFMSRAKARTIGRASQMAIAASKLALKDCGIKIPINKKEKTAVFIGTTTGEIGLFENYNDKKIANRHFDDIYISSFPANALSSNIAIELKIKRQNEVFGNACAAGNYALGRAFDLIRTGRVDYALAGGADGFSRIVFTGFGRLFAMAPKKCQPFDLNRKGMMVGEGAGILFVESLDSAKKRKSKVYAEILGYGLSCDAHHMTAAQSDTVAMAVKKALKASGLSCEAVDYISAHGTGTKENDAAECRAFETVFNSQLKKIPVSSIKSMLGHTMGAASALEAIACCLAIKDGKIPPTINLEKQDSECKIDCVANKARKHRVNVALNNSQAFGGNNACLVLRKL